MQVVDLLREPGGRLRSLVVSQNVHFARYRLLHGEMRILREHKHQLVLGRHQERRTRPADHLRHVQSRPWSGSEEQLIRSAQTELSLALLLEPLAGANRLELAWAMVPAWFHASR